MNKEAQPSQRTLAFYASCNSSFCLEVYAFFGPSQDQVARNEIVAIGGNLLGSRESFNCFNDVEAIGIRIKGLPDGRAGLPIASKRCRA